MLAVNKESRFLKISVIIPTLNEASNIGACLSSIFKQKYPQNFLEVIIVDGNSSDNTVDIAKKFPVKVIYNAKAITGISRRMGVNVATGDVIAFIDADNELPNEEWFCRMITPLIETNTNSIAGVVPMIVVKKTHPPASRLYSLMQANPLVALAFSTGRNLTSDYITEKNYFPIGGNGIFIRRSAIIEAGDFKSIKGQEDVDLTYRIVTLGYSFKVLPDVGIYHLSHRNFMHLFKKICVRITNYLQNYSSLSFKFIPSNKNLFFINDLFMNAFFLKSLLRVVKGIKEDKDTAWLFYPVVFYFSICAFSVIFLSNKNGFSIIRQLFKKN